MELNRDLFLSEVIINYLQSTYPNIYSDNTIVQNYVEYTSILQKKEHTQDDIIRLQELQKYFYGNSDGSSTGSGLGLGPLYISTVKTVKELLNENDNAVRDIITELFSLLNISNISDEAFKEYLNKLIIPGIFAESGINQTLPSTTTNTTTNVNPPGKMFQHIINTRVIPSNKKQATTATPAPAPVPAPVPATTATTLHSTHSPRPYKAISLT